MELETVHVKYLKVHNLKQISLIQKKIESLKRDYQEKQIRLAMNIKMYALKNSIREDRVKWKRLMNKLEKKYKYNLKVLTDYLTKISRIN